MQPELSIIIVNYRSAGLIKDCLATVYGQTRRTNLEVIIVDNASEDDSETQIQSAFPEVRWIQMDYNAGFARANNEGIRKAKADIVLLLNPDTLNVEGAIERCYESFVASGYVAAGVQLLNPDGSPQISGNYFVKGGLNFLLPVPVIGSLVRNIGMLTRARKPHVVTSEGPVEVDWVNGAFLMVRKEATDKAGLLDEDFFLFSEEIEWCSRLRKQGKLVLFGQYRVIHLQGETTGRVFGATTRGYKQLADRRGRQVMLSGFVRIRKQYGVGWFLFHLAAYILAIPLLWLAVPIQAILFLKHRYRVKDAAGYTRNVFSVIARLPRLLWNRPYFYKVL